VRDQSHGKMILGADTQRGAWATRLRLDPPSRLPTAGGATDVAHLACGRRDHLGGRSISAHFLHHGVEQFVCKSVVVDQLLNEIRAPTADVVAQGDIGARQHPGLALDLSRALDTPKSHESLRDITATDGNPVVAED
jgi:hypothetical protein